MAKTGQRFLDQSDILKLAASIGQTQEEKAQISVQKHHHAQIKQGAPKEHRSGFKGKLREIKAQIASDKARLKRTKAQLRKKASAGASIPPEKTTTCPSKKRVSFA